MSTQSTLRENSSESESSVPLSGSDDSGARKSVGLGVGITLLVALLGMINYLGWKYHVRGDWTESQLYSLSNKTRNVLASLDQDVEVVVLMSPASELLQPTRELLSRYDVASPRLSVRMVDPERNLLEAQQLAQELGLSSQAVVFSSGEDRRTVDASNLADLDYAAIQLGQEPEITGFKGEQQFTSALVELTQGQKPKVVFVTGHGERSLDDFAGSGLSGARQLLGEDNFEIEEWASLGADAVPAGTDLLVLAGPTVRLTEPELSLLSSYLVQGGRVVLFVDPVLAKQGGLVDTGLVAWLAGYGVRLGEDIVVDPDNQLPFFGPETLYAKDYGNHPITGSLREGGIPVLVSSARSVSAGSPAAGFEVVELVLSGRGGWGETNLDGDVVADPGPEDVAGPVSLGVAVFSSDSEAPELSAADLLGAVSEMEPATDPKVAEVPEQGSPQGLRLVVFGDSDLVSDSLLQASGGNELLLGDLFNWMVEREVLLGIPPKRPEQVRLELNQGDLMKILLWVALLPLLSILLGVWVWRQRRRI